MTTPERPEQQTSHQEPGEHGGMSDRTAKAVLLLVAVGALWGIVATDPYMAYFVAGILASQAWHTCRAWLARRRGDDDQADEEPGEPLAETMRRLAAPHVFLADLADARGLSKDATRALLEALGIRVRRAVRNGTRTGVGVHKDDLPPLPRPAERGPVGGVDLQQQHNQHGVRVERTDGGLIIYDLSETQRHHQVP
jgi:hypothetical protein